MSINQRLCLSAATAVCAVGVAISLGASPAWSSPQDAVSDAEARQLFGGGCDDYKTGTNCNSDPTNLCGTYNTKEFKADLPNDEQPTETTSCGYTAGGQFCGYYWDPSDFESCDS